MAQSLERIDSYKTITGDATIWTPAAGEIGILMFFWLHAMKENSNLTIETDSVTFLRISNPSSPDNFFSETNSRIDYDVNSAYGDPTHVGQFKIPIEGAVDSTAANHLRLDQTGGLDDLTYSLSVVKES